MSIEDERLCLARGEGDDDTGSRDGTLVANGSCNQNVRSRAD